MSDTECFHFTHAVAVDGWYGLTLDSEEWERCPEMEAFAASILSELRGEDR